MEVISCPSCGSRFNLSGDDEATVTALLSARIPSLRYFELQQPLGSGQFGQVWRARDTELDRLVAVKLPHRRPLAPEDVGFFVREARAAAQLQHPNIVTVYEVGREDETVYIVSEYIDGLSLRDWAKQYDPDVRQTARLCAQIARALEHAHEHGVVHRDMKPANIIVDAEGAPHLTDFGLAKRDGAEVTIAVTGEVLGTPAYMAPEQVRDGHAAEPRSDVYSLGVILYEMLTGRRPFVGGKRLLLHQVLHDDPRPPRSWNRAVPRDLETVCLKAMAKRPEERYASAGEMADDLERYSRGEPVRARRLPRWLRAMRWARRRPAVATSWLLAIGLLAVIPLALARQASPVSTTARDVVVDTTPPGARVVLVPLDDPGGRPQFAQSIDAGQAPARVKCEPGDYLVIAYLDDEWFHEVYRHVPRRDERLPGVYSHLAWTNRDGVVELPLVRLFPTSEVATEMARVSGGPLRASSPTLSLETNQHVEDFFIDVTEVTVGQIRRAELNLPAGMQPPAASDDHPLNMVTWHEAVAYLEALGKRLVREVEFEYLTTRAGAVTDSTGWEAAAVRFPGSVAEPSFDRLEWDRVTRSVVGLRSNVLEWMSDRWASPESVGSLRIVRGGYELTDPAQSPPAVSLDQPPDRIVYPAPLAHHQLGFRGARSVRPRVE